MSEPPPASPVRPTIPLDAAGVHHGHLQLPHSRDDSAYGAVMIPISVVANGDGPTVLLTGGNHGDEYQGPLALTRLVGTIDPADVSGRLIVLPFMNQPAFAAGARTSPIDGGNLNRAFPGSPRGTVTEKIADYLTRYLLPEADMVIDIHDGGRTLEFLPLASSHVMDDTAAEDRNWAAAVAFGAPFVTRLVELDMLGMWDAVVEGAGKPFVTTEIGGGGTTRPEWMRITDEGVQNVLRHWGVLSGDPAPSTSHVLEIPEEDAYLISQSHGLVEWLVDLGDPIRTGQVIARIHDTVHLGSAPTEYRATIDGLLAMRHFPGQIGLGDALAMQARSA